MTLVIIAQNGFEITLSIVGYVLQRNAEFCCLHYCQILLKSILQKGHMLPFGLKSQSPKFYFTLTYTVVYVESKMIFCTYFVV